MESSRKRKGSATKAETFLPLERHDYCLVINQPDRLLPSHEATDICIPNTHKDYQEFPSTKCNFCSVANSIYRCVDCKANICGMCYKYHRSFKFDSFHKIIFTSGEKKNELVDQSCEHHSDELLDIYCNDCDHPICVNCAIDDHREHSVVRVVSRH